MGALAASGAEADAPEAQELRAPTVEVREVDPLDLIQHPGKVVVHRAGSTVTLAEGDTLAGGDAVPGFRCAVAELFPQPL